MAATLEEVLSSTEGVDFEQLKQQVEEMSAASETLQPLQPLHFEDQSIYAADWPMTNLRLQEAERASKLFSKQNDLNEKGDGQFFDAQAFGTSNAALSNILKDEPKQQEAPVVAQITENVKWNEGSDSEISLGDDDFEDSKAQEASVDAEDAGGEVA